MIIRANKGKIGGVHDKVKTPDNIVKIIMGWIGKNIKDNSLVLDSAMGNGAFYSNFDNRYNKDWCEIDKGKDFFQYNNKVDWIITNPPYSIFDAFLDHSFKISDNVVFLCPLSKIVSSMGRIKKYKEYGGVPKILIMSSSKCGFPFGFPSCAVWFKRRYKNNTKIEVI